MPVDSHSHSGVWIVTAGSSITTRGMIPGCRINSLTRCRSSVTPAIALNSPADNVVGTVTCGTVGGFMPGRREHAIRSLDRPQRVDRVGALYPVGETELHRLGAVGNRAAADSGDQIGLDFPWSR
jgi:hypothetical protein